MIAITKEALEILTDAQRRSLCNLDNNVARNYLHHIEVIKAFDLPEGYVSVIIPYQTSTIFGGISPEGELST